MSFRRTLGATALVAGAFTLAACGSDKAAGPTTANNEQIISEMQASMDAGDNMTFASTFGFQFAITALASGSPVNPVTVVIDGQSHRFNTAVMNQEERDSTTGALISRMSYLVGWRNTSGDSVFLAVYAPAPETSGDLRAPIDFGQLSGAGSNPLAALSAMRQSGRYTVSRDISAGPTVPGIVLFGLGDAIWGAGTDQGLESGSMSYAVAPGVCDMSLLETFELPNDFDGCEALRASVNLRGRMTSGLSGEGGDTSEVEIPEQSMIGITLVNYRDQR